MKQLSYSLLMDAGALLFCITCREARFFFVKKLQEVFYSFLTERGALYSRIEDLSYSLLKDREASYFLFTNRKYFLQKDRKVLLLLANGHKSYLNPYEQMEGLSFFFIQNREALLSFTRR